MLLELPPSPKEFIDAALADDLMRELERSRAAEELKRIYLDRLRKMGGILVADDLDTGIEEFHENESLGTFHNFYNLQVEDEI